MKTVIVWVLFVSFGNNYNNPPVVYDNIASKEECIKIARKLKEHRPTSYNGSTCIQVEKKILIKP